MSQPSTCAQDHAEHDVIGALAEEVRQIRVSSGWPVRKLVATNAGVRRPDQEVNAIGG